MRRALLTLALLGLAASSWAAAGSVVVTSQVIVGAGVVRYDIAWTSSAGGAVSGNALNIRRGRIMQAEFVPGSGGTQPTNLYDAVFNDVNGVDLLSSAGADLSNSTSKLIQFNPPIYYDGTTALDLVISNAGASKTGTFTLWVSQ